MEKLNEENLDRIIDELLKDDEISTEEKKILFRYKKNYDKSFMNRVHYLKEDLSILNLEKGIAKGLNPNVFNLYRELIRQHPKTGPASIFNGLIK
ncbi:Uncharacterised protein [Anaerococcus prevotii]|uniref:Bacteriocin immunity protein n=1 Tax=Anaerococcus prevotii (strain ATCC 9321 / DSM 20548 / JCM 6508 / NCTC 11806 / PC1) TaxID=525919 RepID=C7RFR9_ANAPD|nr:hypothetical protein [Anaerococcus prevotii]ACV28330.1 hypothetical protein Apre_0279 [Anaerococcus prevotii DSM 20548]SUU93885.1 Uncharacterised protein [Anaerococcus prevotii]